MAGGGNPFAGTRLGGPGPTPRPRPTAGSSRRPTHPPASQKPKTPQSVSHLFDEDDTEDDPFAGYKPKGRGSMQATLDAVGLNDAVDPEDPFGIGTPPLSPLEYALTNFFWVLADSSEVRSAVACGGKAEG